MPKKSISRFTTKEENQHHLQVCIALASHLTRHYNFIVHREWFIVLDNEDKFVGIPRYEITEYEKSRKNKYRNPDLMWCDNGLWILEVDGYVHYIKSAKTDDRNNIYKNNDCKFLTIDIYEMVGDKVKNKPLTKIIDELDYLIKNGQ